MSSVRRSPCCGVALIFLLAGAVPLAASPVSDFAARLAQASWSIQQTESLVRSQPVSALPVATPEALASYVALVSENVGALVEIAAARVTDEQRRVMAEGLKSIASVLKDESSLAGHRGLTAVASVLMGLESSCRAAI